MPAIRYNPVTAGRRNSSVLTRESVTREKPEKSLLRKLTKNGGRNNKGRITTRHKGGGHKRRYRLIDFKRRKDGVPATVAAVEYDPNRSANIALLHYHDGEKRYILAPRNLTVGSIVMSGPDAEVEVGNTLPLNRIPVGTVIHNVELGAGARGPDGPERRDERPARRPREVAWLRCGCLRVSGGGCRALAGRRSGSSGTSRTRTCAGARRVASGTSGFVRRCAVRL